MQPRDVAVRSHHREPSVACASCTGAFLCTANTAEDRYQTAAAVERDLRRCLAHSDAERRIDAFALAEDDTPDRLVIPEKLYGRAREIDTLIGAFVRVVASGTPELATFQSS
jgi:hypothetical protein